MLLGVYTGEGGQKVWALLTTHLQPPPPLSFCIPRGAPLTLLGVFTPTPNHYSGGQNVLRAPAILEAALDGARRGRGARVPQQPPVCEEQQSDITCWLDLGEKTSPILKKEKKK